MSQLADRMSRAVTSVATLGHPTELQRWSGDAFRHGQRARGYLGREVAILSTAIQRVWQEDITRRAAALAFSTLLALVPLLAVAFALFQAFGGLAAFEAEFRSFVLENLATARTEEISQWLDRFVGNVSAGAIAGVGVLVLFYTAMSLLSNVEQTFDQVWGSSRQRSQLTRFAIYWSAITLAPVLLAASLSLSASFYTQVGERFVEQLPWGIGALLIQLASVVPIILAQLFVYLVVPTSRIPLRYAAAGAVLAGVLFAAGRQLFVTLTASSAKYSAIYGALAALPLLMMWLHLSWTFVLLGLGYAKARQLVACGRPLEGETSLSLEERRRLTLVSLAAMARRWLENEPPLTSTTLAKEIDVDEALLDETTAALKSANLVAETEDERLLLTVDPAQITLDRVARAAEGEGHATVRLREMPLTQSASHVIENADHAWQAALHDMTLEQFVASTQEGTDS